jgi:hypothetical protein
LTCCKRGARDREENVKHCFEQESTYFTSISQNFGPSGFDDTMEPFPFRTSVPRMTLRSIASFPKKYFNADQAPQTHVGYAVSLFKILPCRGDSLHSSLFRPAAPRTALRSITSFLTTCCNHEQSRPVAVDSEARRRSTATLTLSNHLECVCGGRGCGAGGEKRCEVRSSYRLQGAVSQLQAAAVEVRPSESSGWPGRMGRPGRPLGL